jgi:manganese efflux pump family protein
VLKLILFVLPLGLDTFAVSAALGMGGLPRRARLRVSLLMAGFELAMPLVGLAVGRGLGDALGAAADYVAAGALFALAAWMLVSDEETTALAGTSGLALVGLGLSISLDELAMGFTIGLLHLNIWFAVVLIGAQAFLVAQLGLRLGARLGERLRERAEQLAGLTLIGLAVLLAVEKTT